MRRILTHLGFMIAGNGPVVKVAVPSWRTDVHGKADIVEEIVRIVGVDKVPMTPFERGEAPRKPVLTPIQLRTRRAKRALAARGMVEAVTWSFISKPACRIVRRRRRPSSRSPIRSHPICPTCGRACCRAWSPRRRPMPIAASPMSRCSRSARSSRATSRRTSSSPHPAFATALPPRQGIGRHWSGSATADAFDAKADALAVLAAAGAPMQALQIVPGGATWLHPGRSGTIQIGPQNVLGYFGELHPRTLEALGADGPLIAFEVILDRIPEAKQKPTRAKPVLELSAFQPVSRDFAFIVDRTVKAGDIVRAAQGVDKKLITDVTVFDVYEGKGIDDGQEVDRDRRDDAAAREDADRPGDRRGGGEDRGRGDEEDRRHVAGMSRMHPEPASRPTISVNCRDRDLRDRVRRRDRARLLRFRLGADLHAARQQHRRAAAGRRAAADHRFRRRGAAAAERWQKADRKATAIMVLGALVGVPIGTYFLSRLEPVTTRWIISGFVFALLLLLLSGWRYRGKDHAGDLDRHRRPLRLLQRTRADRRPADRRLLARPPDRVR